MKRRLAAILAADVVGYARLLGKDTGGTLRPRTKLREQVLEPPYCRRAAVRAGVLAAVCLPMQRSMPYN